MKKCTILLILFFVQIFSLNPCYAIKIGLVDGAERAFIGCSTKSQIINGKTNRLLYSLSAMKGYELRAYHNGISIKIGNDYFDLGTNYAVIKPESNGFISVKGKWYRGFFIVYNREGLLVVINKVEIEDYIKGVVPSEMPSGWSL
jgi:stage II sporulation protein D